MNKTMQLLKNLWITFRPHFFFVSGAAGLSGMAFAYLDPPLWRTLATFIICFFSYGLIQALCDTFDLETDRINAPFRPMVSGELPVKTVVLVLSVTLLGVAVIFFLMNPILLGVQLIALVFSLTYNGMKRIPHAGPLWNGIIVATLPYIGAFGISEARSVADLPPVIHFNAVIVCFVYAGFVLTGYFKDVTGDSQTGYRTAPVFYGIRKARWQVLPYSLFAAGGFVLYYWNRFGLWEKAAPEAKVIYAILGIVGVTLLVLSNIILIRDPSEKNSYGALLWYTRGMVLTFLSPVALGYWHVALGTAFVFMISMEYFLLKTRRTGQA